MVSGRARMSRVKNPVVSVPRVAWTRPCEFGLTPVTRPVAGFTMVMVESSGVTHTTGAPTLSPFALSGTAMNCVVSPKSTVGGDGAITWISMTPSASFAGVAAGR